MLGIQARPVPNAELSVRLVCLIDNSFVPNVVLLVIETLMHQLIFRVGQDLPEPTRLWRLAPLQPKFRLQELSAKQELHSTNPEFQNRFRCWKLRISNAERKSRGVFYQEMIIRIVQNMKVVIVIPVWNEEGNIGSLIKAIKSIDISYEVIAIDKGSTDNTKKEVDENGGIYALQKGSGYGGALRTGFVLALERNADLIVTMDGDWSHSPKYIPRLVKKLNGNTDVVIASRYCVGGGYEEKKGFQVLLSRVLNWVLAKRFSIPITDFSSGFRIYKKRVVEEIKPVRNGYDVLEEILILANDEGFQIEELPFVYKKRMSGKSKTQMLKLAPKYLSIIMNGR